MNKIVYCVDCKHVYIKDLVCGECEKKNKLVRPWEYCKDGEEEDPDEDDD